MFRLIFVLCWLINSANSITEIKVCTYVMSQNAFDDAPGRYAEFVLQALKMVEQHKLNDMQEVHGCSTSYWIWASRSQKKLSIVPGTLKIDIQSDGVLVSANVHTYIKTPAKVQWRERIIFCFKSNVCNGDATLTGNFQLSVKFTTNFTKDGIEIKAIPHLDGNSFKVDGCHPPWWMNLFGDVKQLIHDKIEEQIKLVIQQVASKFNVKNTFSPYKGVYFNYQMAKVTYISQDRIVATATCTVQADHTYPNGTIARLTFDDPDSSGANMLPPTDWDLGLINGSLYQLQGVRLSSSIFEALMWAADTVGVFNKSKTVPFLDTNITLTSQFTSPMTSVDSDNNLIVTVHHGRIDIKCDSGNETKPILDVSFQKLSGNGTIYATPDKIGS